jgi:hypothetical protein
MLSVVRAQKGSILTFLGRWKKGQYWPFLGGWIEFLAMIFSSFPWSLLNWQR